MSDIGDVHNFSTILPYLTNKEIINPFPTVRILIDSASSSRLESKVRIIDAGEGEMRQELRPGGRLIHTECHRGNPADKVQCLVTVIVVVFVADIK